MLHWLGKQKCRFFHLYRKKKIYIDKKFTIDAANLLLSYGFEVLNLHRIWSEIYDFDKKKIKMFKELNFSLDGKFKEHTWAKNKWRDSLFFGLLSSDYFKNKKRRI